MANSIVARFVYLPLFSNNPQKEKFDLRDNEFKKPFTF